MSLRWSGQAFSSIIIYYLWLIVRLWYTFKTANSQFTLGSSIWLFPLLSCCYIKCFFVFFATAISTFNASVNEVLESSNCFWLFETFYCKLLFHVATGDATLYAHTCSLKMKEWKQPCLYISHPELIIQALKVVLVKGLSKLTFLNFQKPLEQPCWLNTMLRLNTYSRYSCSEQCHLPTEKLKVISVVNICFIGTPTYSIE